MLTAATSAAAAAAAATTTGAKRTFDAVVDDDLNGIDIVPILPGSVTTATSAPRTMPVVFAGTGGGGPRAQSRVLLRLNHAPTKAGQTEKVSIIKGAARLVAPICYTEINEVPTSQVHILNPMVWRAPTEIKDRKAKRSRAAQSTNIQAGDVLALTFFGAPNAETYPCTGKSGLAAGNLVSLTVGALQMEDNTSINAAGVSQVYHSENFVVGLPAEGKPHPLVYVSDSVDTYPVPRLRNALYAGLFASSRLPPPPIDVDEAFVFTSGATLEQLGYSTELEDAVTLQPEAMSEAFRKARWLHFMIGTLGTPKYQLARLKQVGGGGERIAYYAPARIRDDESTYVYDPAAHAQASETGAAAAAGVALAPAINGGLVAAKEKHKEATFRFSVAVTEMEHDRATDTWPARKFQTLQVSLRAAQFGPLMGVQEYTKQLSTSRFVLKYAPLTVETYPSLASLRTPGHGDITDGVRIDWIHRMNVPQKTKIKHGRNGVAAIEADMAPLVIDMVAAAVNAGVELDWEAVRSVWEALEAHDPKRYAFVMTDVVVEGPPEGGKPTQVDLRKSALNQAGSPVVCLNEFNGDIEKKLLGKTKVLGSKRGDPNEFAYTPQYTFYVVSSLLPKECAYVQQLDAKRTGALFLDWITAVYPEGAPQNDAGVAPPAELAQHWIERKEVVPPLHWLVYAVKTDELRERGIAGYKGTDVWNERIFPALRKHEEQALNVPLIDTAALRAQAERERAEMAKGAAPVDSPAGAQPPPAAAAAAAGATVGTLDISEPMDSDEDAAEAAAMGQ